MRLYFHPSRALIFARAASALAVLVACSGESSTGGSTVVYDSAGVKIVDNASSLWSEQQPWTVAAEPSVRIGAVDSNEPAFLFTNVRAGTRLPDGHIVVVDGQTNEIRWFDPEGQHVVTRGGRGRGPGEFTSITHMFRIAGDTIVVQNAPMIKHVLFSASGEWVREETIDWERYRAFGRWLECLTHTLPDRSLLGCQIEPGLPAAASNSPGRLRTYARYVRVPWTMEAAYPLGLHGGIEQWGMDVGGGQIRYAVHPFHAWTVVAAGGDPLRVAIALNPVYSIEVWSPEGQLERIIRRRSARQVPTESQRAAAREQMREFGFRDDAIFNRLLAEMPEPDSIPAVAPQGLAFGPAGDLWVTRGRLFSSSDSTLIDVFDDRGYFLGSLKLPPRVRLLEIGHEYVLGVRHDEDNVPTVEVYSLTR